MIPLFTSIPPRTIRTTSDGSDIGDEYASMCVRSWRSSGFDPVTVNSHNEAIADVVHEENVRSIRIDRDAQKDYGKPLVFFSDFLKAACAGCEGPIAITNADIVLDVPGDVYDRISSLPQGKSLVAKRLDVDDFGSSAGSEYRHGYDLFVFHTADLRKFSFEGFVFGMPWWDHVLPIDMYLNGIEGLPSDLPIAFHLKHSERWDFERWVTLGRHFLKSVRRRLDSGAYSPERALGYGSDLSQARAGPDVDVLERLTRPLRRLSRSYRVQDEIEMLTRVADLNVAWLDHIRTASTGALQAGSHGSS